MFLHLISLLLIFLMGCQTTSSESKAVTNSEDLKALKSIAGSVARKDLSDEEFRRLSQQVQKDPQVKSAVNAITNSMGQGTTQVKYCPVDGKRFSGRLKICPEHQVELKSVDE